jgi:hypothetical protein
MARIFQEGNKFLLITRDGEKKLAFYSSLRGSELRGTLLGYGIEVFINWDIPDIVADLEESGLLPIETLALIQEKKSEKPEFTTMPGKWASWWFHSSGVAKMFNNIQDTPTDNYRNEDSWVPGSGQNIGHKKMVMEMFTAEMAANDFARYPETWKPYTKTYDRNLRADVVKLVEP